MAVVNTLRLNNNLYSLPASYVMSKPAQPIVIVDDNHDDRTFLAHELNILLNEKTPIVSLPNGKKFIDYMNELEMQNVEALEFEIEIPSLVFIDLLMPRQDGIQTIQILRSKKIWKNIPLVIVTASRDKSVIEQAKKLGANILLLKPFIREDVKTAWHDSKDFLPVL